MKHWKEYVGIAFEAFIVALFSILGCGTAVYLFGNVVWLV